MTLSYTYDLIADNYNLRTIQGFSTGSSDVFINCQRCPLSTHQKFVNYYGDFFYADDFIQAALDGSQTNFENGNIDFARVGSQGRSGESVVSRRWRVHIYTALSLFGSHLLFSLGSLKEAIKRFTVYLNIWMFVVGMLEFSIEACIENELLNSLSYWDQAVAFYVGSLEGTDGSGDGLLLYHLADQICVEFDSCDENGSSAVNRNVFEVFKNGQSDVAQGDCIAVEARKNRIVSLLSVPMIQGGILYTAKTDKGERDHIAGFVFASAILPLLYDCNREKAAIIYDAFKNSFEMGVDTTTVLPLVTAAFEDNYECLGITCKDVGDLYGAELCGGPLAGSKAGNSSGSDVDNPDIWNGEESSSFTVMSITIRWIYLTVPIVGWVLLFAA